MTASTASAADPPFYIRPVIARAAASLRAHGVALIFGSLLVVGAMMSGGRYLSHPLLVAWGATDGSGFNFRTFFLNEALSMLDGVCGALVTAWIAVVVIGDPTSGSSIGPRAAAGLVLRRAGPIAIQTVLLTLGVFIGFVALVVPGVLLSLGWILATPAQMAEGLSPVQALRRSWRLTRGYRGGVFVLILLWSIPLLVIELALAKLFGGSGTWVQMLAAPPMRMAVLPIVGSLAHVIFAAGVASTYVELVNLKEGGATSRMGEVFA